MQIRIEDRAKEFICGLPEKDRRIIGEPIEEFIHHPHARWNIKRLKTKNLTGVCIYHGNIRYSIQLMPI